ncbi:MAG: hypothetical protein AAB296_07780 [Candidatus Desantisbacteria bacterium]
MMKRVCLAILIPMLLLSCAENKNMLKEDEKPVHQQEVEKVFNGLDEKTEDRDTINTASRDESQPALPAWFYQPGVLGAVGAAEKQEKGGYAAQKRLAIVIAQAEIAKQIEIIINTELQTEKTMVNNDYHSKLSSLSKQETQQLIKNAVVKEEWTNPKTGELYVWVVIER